MPTGVWSNSEPTICRECKESFVGHGAQRYCSVTCRKRARKYERDPRQLSAATIGSIAELLVCQDLLAKGLQVFRAVTPHASCDLVVFNDKGMWRVEVKQARIEACKTEPGVFRWCFSLKQEKNPSADILALVAPSSYNSVDNILYAPHRVKTYVKSVEGFNFWLGTDAPVMIRKSFPVACPHGHMYSEENTYHTRAGRVCKTCRNDYRRKFKQQKKVGLHASAN